MEVFLKSFFIVEMQTPKSWLLFSKAEQWIPAGSWKLENLDWAIMLLKHN